MQEKFEESMEALKLYIRTLKSVPSEARWNNYAREERLLSSKSIEYYCDEPFNQLCRRLKKTK